MAEETTDDTEHVELDLMIEFYLKGRDDPMPTFATIRFAKEKISAEKVVQDVMDFTLHFLLSVLDTVGEHRYVVRDQRRNVAVILTSEIQAFSVLAPDEDQLLEKLNA